MHRHQRLDLHVRWEASRSSATTVRRHQAATGSPSARRPTITIDVTVNGGVTLPIVNTATRHWPRSRTAAISENAANTQPTTWRPRRTRWATGIDLVVSKIADHPDPVTPGQKLTYTVVAVNGGTAEAASGRSDRRAADGRDLPQRRRIERLQLPAARTPGLIDLQGRPAGRRRHHHHGEASRSCGAPADLTLAATVDPPHADIPTASHRDDRGEQHVTETDDGRGRRVRPPCTDLVAAQLVGSPDTYRPVTMTRAYVMVNVGDTSTTLDPNGSAAAVLRCSRTHGSSTGR